MAKYYTGVGSRETPEQILKMMTDLAYHLSLQGWTLRSGGAWGADEAFQKGVTDYSNIFLPYKNFRKDEGIQGRWINDPELTSQAMYIMSQKKGHPHWEHWLNNNSQASNVRLHMRNVFQVLGENLNDPAKFLVCWTRDEACTYDETSYATGGTGTAIRLAHIYGVPVFNLSKLEHKIRIENWINELKEESLKKIECSSQIIPSKKTKFKY